eukprot:comp18336_c1_seq1/m.19430 comp18336_c1_seq1/g.19430  ORF comp18336_c1_seq1/g.19430 comp18336_c1_seq1/m.19430 type:complete len:263 (-) comp18336_c1_seq1:102-890(-)
MEDKGTERKPGSLPALLTLPTNAEKRPLMIGVCGGTASGKTTVCQMIMEQLGAQANDNFEHMAVLVHQDSFYQPLPPDVDVELYNFDHPDAFDNDLIYQTLMRLADGQPVDIPIYDFTTHKRTDKTVRLFPAPVILFEGILSLYHKEWRELFDLKLFVECDPDTRLARRVLRDIEHRGRDLDSVLWQYVQFVKPSFEDYILPTKKYADIIIPRGADNNVAIDLIVQHIREQDGHHPHSSAQMAQRMNFALPSPHAPSSFRPH